MNKDAKNAAAVIFNSHVDPKMAQVVFSKWIYADAARIAAASLLGGDISYEKYCELSILIQKAIEERRNE